MQAILSFRVVHWCLLAILLVSGISVAQQNPTDNELRLQSLVRGLVSRLGIEQRVEVSIVPVEAQMVSVKRVRKGPVVDHFRIQIDEQFFHSLNEEDLKAAIAHELGHVWIYSHFPYLHTEALANEIAMRAVSRDSLRDVYLKLWARLGANGNLDELLGHDKTVDPVAAVR
jgi:hypothetical protein